jgi:hypothetical protein
MKETIFNAVEKKFNTAFAWNLSGSIIFEGLRVAHNTLLMSLVAKSVFGTIGSLFSVMFLIARIMDFGGSFSIPPFFKKIFVSKQSFLRITTFLFALPTLTIGIVAATVVYYFNTFSHHKSLLIIVLVTALLEGIRSLLRKILYTNFFGRYAIISELFVFFMFLGIVWGGYFLFSFKLTPIFVCTAYFIDAFTAIVIFLLLTRKIYLELPSVDQASSTNVIEALWYNIMKTRAFNFCLRLSKELFNSNFITPLFAYKFGLAHAGIFYFASNIGIALQAVVRVGVGYSGDALLANLKNESVATRVSAFDLICKKLTSVVIPIVIILFVNYRELMSLVKNNGPWLLFAFASLYLLLIFSEFFFSVYEQFYIIEDRTSTLLLFKFLEFVLLLSVIHLGRGLTSLIFFISILVVRAVSFTILTTHAYATWRIKPTFKSSSRVILGYVSVAVIIKFFLIYVT